MSIVSTKLGPADHGQPMSYEEFMAGDYEEGYHYELINGELYVFPLPDLPEDFVEKWIFYKIYQYSLERPKIINHVTNKPRVFLPKKRRITAPEPDVAAYHDFPLHLPISQMNWRNVSPVLVVEVLSADDPHKDLIRNVNLYWQVASIQEYWILDSRENADQPTMRVHRRNGDKWRLIELAYRDRYTTRLLPGFELIVDPRR